MSRRPLRVLLPVALLVAISSLGSGCATIALWSAAVEPEPWSLTPRSVSEGSIDEDGDLRLAVVYHALPEDEEVRFEVSVPMARALAGHGEPALAEAGWLGRRALPPSRRPVVVVDGASAPAPALDGGALVVESALAEDGVITMWDGAAGRRVRVRAPRLQGDDRPAYIAAAVLATPVALAVDAGLAVLVAWLLSEDDDDGDCQR